TDIAVDSAGNAHVVGSTDSNDFPVVHAYQPARGGGIDAFVTKLNPAGSAVVYSTYLGGSAGDTNNFRSGIALDTSGNAYVTSRTESIDFPTLNALQGALGGFEDAFVTKFDPVGSVLYSTFLGGSSFEIGNGIAADSSGNAYVIGDTFSSNFPTMNPLQSARAGAEDAFLTKISDPFLDVAIDIKPGSFPNSINLGSAGTVPVAIFSSATFDARTIDPLTITLAGAQVKLKGKGTPQYSVEHVDNDGRLDIVVHVSTEALQLTENDTEAVLNGVTSDGRRIRGSDSIRIVP
ncbi:MAG: SBBP repeat-containing protein, partial [Vicinamibacterales bacterium]